jgi:hypothetical protein
MITVTDNTYAGIGKNIQEAATAFQYATKFAVKVDITEAVVTIRFNEVPDAWLEMQKGT